MESASASIFYQPIRAYSYQCLAISSLVFLSSVLSPFDGPPGRFEPERAEQLRGKRVYVPSEMRSKYERHRFVIPGATIVGYDPADRNLVSSLLESRQFVVVHRAMNQPATGPYRVFAKRLDLRSRQTLPEIAQIVLGADLGLLIRQELVLRRHRARRELGARDVRPGPS